MVNIMYKKDFHVVVVGGGLVGPVCALYLSKRGFNVTLYEYRQDPRKSGYLKGRSINLAVSHRARKALRELGLEEDVLQSGIPMKGRYLHNLNGKHKPIYYDPLNHECIYSVSRSYLNRILLDATSKYPNLQVIFEHKLVDAKTEDGLLTFFQTNTKTIINVQANLVIGADGAYSALRKCMLQKPLFDFSQTYIDHGYIELCITPEYGNFLTLNYLHIWPRNEFMMIALPNCDNSWTVTLFMPFKKFEELNDHDKVIAFFSITFPDIIQLIGENQLVKDFFKNKPSPLVYIKCSRYHDDDKVLLIGDAAHAMVPFYGQGMNAGFEDCVVLNQILDECKDSIPTALKLYTERRKNNAHAICDLALYNYIEMRDLVTRPSYRIRKCVDDILFNAFPNYWIPLYNSITFTDMEYEKCIYNRRWQDKFMVSAAFIISIIGLIAIFIA